MAVLAASSIGGSITASLRVQQAQRNADRAEQEARSLRASAERAQNVADREQANARSLNIQADRAQNDAGQARLGLSALEASQRNLQNFGDRAEQIVSSLPVAAPVAVAEATAPVVASAAPAVVNSEGQTTGTVINVTA